VILFFCVYLVQRGVRTIAHAPEFLVDRYQQSYMGVQLSYETLTFVWPLFLGLLSLTFCHLASRQLTIVRYVRSNSRWLSHRELVVIDPLLPSPIDSKWSMALFSVISRAPFLACSVHAGGCVAAIIMSEYNRVARTGAHGLITFVGVAAMSVFGVWASIHFRSAMLMVSDEVMKEEPNKAPEPTPGSVTPRAIEGQSK
jgi:hypothetical protein